MLSICLVLLLQCILLPFYINTNICFTKCVSYSLIFKIDTPSINEPVREKTNNLGSEQVRLKPGCTVTEDG